MSDVAELTATGSEAAPVAAPESPAVPAQPSQEIAGFENLSPKERARARGRALDEARRKAEQARTQARAGDGRFTQETSDVAEAAPVVSESESPAAPEASAESKAVGPAEGFERVELPEGHPLRQSEGVTHVDVPKDSARHVKALLNGTYHRRHEVEAAVRRAQELEDRMAQMEAETRFRAEHGHEFWTQDDQALYEDIKEKYSEEQAEAYRQSKIQQAEAALRERAEQAQLEAVAGRVAGQATEFRTDAMTQLPKLYPGLTTAEVETALSMYAHELDKVQQRAVSNGMSPTEFFRKFGGYNEQDFFRVAKDYIETRPGVISRRGQAARVSEVERNRVRAEVEAQKAAELQQAAKRHAQNPNRALGGGSVAPSIPESSSPPDNVGKSVTEIRKTGKARFLDRVRERYGG